ncbi:hypothetical protein Acsp03_34950 [Actinomadura sp. NBRC 104412]|uniref:hypothetical protein n=1 Tax=Actinomadura sp. NBRC 104412 TaxID=3032203 RepID=UPI0024A14BCD|nr:hypothetical protein [Actinomadura sp. NBRC 104412]GLZ06029.1 hypothetical protein Acsp03_34950 [Actinomadura sp. NBRC 104412]
MRNWTRHVGRTIVVAAGVAAIGAGLGSANAETRSVPANPDPVGGLLGSLGSGGSGLPVLDGAQNGLGTPRGLNQQGGMLQQPPSEINYNDDGARTAPGSPGPIGGLDQALASAITGQLLQALQYQTQGQQQQYTEEQYSNSDSDSDDQYAAPQQQPGAPQQHTTPQQQGQQPGQPGQQGQQGQQGQLGLKQPDTGLPLNVGKNTPLFP